MAPIEHVGMQYGDPTHYPTIEDGSPLLDIFTNQTFDLDEDIMEEMTMCD